MPELPEVETTKNGIEPWLINKTITKINIHNDSLRWPIPHEIIGVFTQQTIINFKRRGKYILIQFDNSQTLIIHLGMSGSLRIITDNSQRAKHDHFEMIISKKLILRYNDPRRFGCILYTDQPDEHKLIKHLGPEPLTDEFDGDYLKTKSKNKTQAVKNFIMDGKVVVGVGNIYACESLFLARINPKKPASKVSKKAYQKLATEIKKVLSKAIQSGGTTLKDFVNSDGEPGYFAQQLHVYGRKDQECTNCKSAIKQVTIGQRSTFYCGNCQK